MSARDRLSITLLLLLALPALTLAGTSVSGTWIPEDSPYIFTEDITVPLGESLEVMPGVTVVFSEGTVFEVEGELHVMGTEKDPVRFDAQHANEPWAGIVIHGSDEGLASTFQYAQIKNAETGVSAITGQVIMDRCFVEATRTGVYLVFNSFATLTSSSFEVNARRSYAHAVFARDSAVEISDCQARMNVVQESGSTTGAGIYLHNVNADIDSVDVSVLSASGASGIMLVECDDVTLSRSTVHVRRNGSGDELFASALRISGTDMLLDRLSLHIETDAGLISGIAAYESSDLLVRNTIIAAPEAESGVEYYAAFLDPWQASSSLHLSYSCVYEVALTNPGAEGFSYDVNSVLNQDPLWENAEGESYYLQSDSPCIDTGDPSSQRDPDMTRADMGAHYYPHTAADEPSIATMPMETELHAAWPNPFNDATRMAFTLPRATPVTLTVVDMLGRTVATVAEGTYTAGRHEVHWAPAGASRVSSGVYLVQLRAGQQVQSGKLVLMK